MLLPILYNIIVPVFALVGLGFFLDRKLELNMQTLGDLNFYVFAPALVFIVIVDADMSLAVMGSIGGFCLVHLLILYIVGRFFFSIHTALKQRQTVLSLCNLFYNAGNFGVPLILLAFGETHLEVIAVILATQNFLSFTVGIGLLEKDRHPGKLFMNLMKVPMIQVILLALLIRLVGFDFKSFQALAKPVEFLAAGLIPVALITLGAQLSRSRPSGLVFPLTTVSILRLLISPLIAAALVPLFGFEKPISTILIVSAGLPVAVNVAILACVYKQDEDVASQSVFWTTILSALTVSILLLIS